MRNLAAVCATSVLLINMLAGCSDNKTNPASNQLSSSSSADTGGYGPKSFDSSKIDVDKDLKSFTKTKTGLMYKDLIIGKGASPKMGDSVSVNYTGYLEDGTVFDSTNKTGQPFAFPIGRGQVIRGWDEGVMDMKEGGKRRLIIPPDLGYGSKDSGPIPANSTLYFDVELLKAKAEVPAH